MKLDDKSTLELLLKGNYITKDDVASATEAVKSHRGSAVDFLFSEGIITKELLGQGLAEHFGVPYADLSKEKVDSELFFLIPELVARRQGVVALSRIATGVRVGMTNPKDLETVHIVEKRLGEKAVPHFITEKDLREALGRYKGSIKEEFKNILAKLQQKSLSREERDEVTVQMVDTLLQYGYENKSSDIHIEPYEKKIVIRFRIDGIMHDVLELPKELLEIITTRIKILAKMRTDEHRAAQDGKIRFKSGGEALDIRVSVVPVSQGENVVMRLLSSRARQFSLTDLGFSSGDLKKTKRAIKHPHGMILVTGPTGSGKTTTLYAIMKIVNKREVNIATIEDPIEYDVEGVSQIQVNPKTNLTFAKGLRAIVRQDPDIIMIGEIRDEETAGIAVNSALTGHLVLSTLHTNDAATTLPRLLDMGIEPFLVASTVNVAIAQRLVRKICTTCRVSHKLSAEESKLIVSNAYLKEILEKKGYKKLTKVRLYKGSGCEVCGHTGYTGRVGVFEVLEMAENIKDLILKHASSDEIMKVARENGMSTMMEDGVGKVLNGVTTLEEVLRVTAE